MPTTKDKTTPQGDQDQKAPKGHTGNHDQVAYEAVVELLKDHPQGVTVAQVAAKTQLRGRVLENTLWRLCPQVPGDLQAGGGKHNPPKLIRVRTTRPVTFILYTPQAWEEITSPPAKGKGK